MSFVGKRFCHEVSNDDQYSEPRAGVVAVFQNVRLRLRALVKKTFAKLRLRSCPDLLYENCSEFHQKFCAVLESKS